VFPIIPVACWLVGLCGGGGLAWYYSLTTAQKAEADRISAKYARDLYQLAVEQLSPAQTIHVRDMTRNHFRNVG